MLIFLFECLDIQNLVLILRLNTKSCLDGPSDELKLYDDYTILYRYYTVMYTLLHIVSYGMQLQISMSFNEYIL